MTSALAVALLAFAGCDSAPSADCDDVVAYYRRCDSSRLACRLQDDRDYCVAQQSYYRADVVTGLARCAARTDLACSGTGGETLDDCQFAVFHNAPISDAARNFETAYCRYCTGFAPDLPTCVAMRLPPMTSQPGDEIDSGRDDLLNQATACIGRITVTGTAACDAATACAQAVTSGILPDVITSACDPRDAG